MLLSASIITRLQYQHQTISELTNNFTKEQLRLRSNPDKWSAFENIAHLAAYQPTFIQRIELMLKEEAPSFERYVAENDNLFYECIKLSMPKLISKTDDDRVIIFNRLRSLSHEQLSRTGKHPKYGSLKIAQWADFFLLHEAHHLWAVMQLTCSIV
jgi:DinB family protein